jgi:ADP-ribosylglycohydrolase
MSTPSNQHLHSQRVVSSMLWAAWADALGFISELTDEAGLRRRLGDQPLRTPVTWTRRVGGRFGVAATLPAGCYSDDTQLRLATARAISNHGFDIDAFALVELTVWPAYALGGGRACKAAVANLAKSGTPWFGNFFAGWIDAGGNGAAMRVQPHVWAAPRPAELGPHLLDVFVNAVTTHGHPRALVGAILHAVALGTVLHTGEISSPNQWPALLDITEQAIKLLDEHPQLSSLWRPSWEHATGRGLYEAWHDTIEECRHMLPTAHKAVDALKHAESTADISAQDSVYYTLTSSLGLADPATRGSGTATVIASLVLAAAYPNDPPGCARLAARAIGTDTDTIATMAAALVGAVADASAPEPLLDSPYLVEEARRLAHIAADQPTEMFSYPDPLRWTPPRTQLDAVGMIDGTLALAGLGWLEPVPNSEPLQSHGGVWRWMCSDFGPTFLLKQRPTARALPEGARPIRRRQDNPSTRNPQLNGIHEGQPPAYNTAPASTRKHRHGGVLDPAPPGFRRQERERSEEIDVDQILAWVAHKGYADEAIGYAIRRLVARGTVEQLIAFTTALRAIAKGTAPSVDNL